MKAPAFQFYPADFIMGTAEMTAEEVGGYIRALCHQWTKEGLPNNRKKLEAMLGINGDSLDTILEKFTLYPDGRLKNDRLEKIRAEQMEYRAKQAENGKKGGNPAFKKGQSNPYYKPEDKPKDNPTVMLKDNPTDNPTDKPTDNPKINPSPSSSTSIKEKDIIGTNVPAVLSDFEKFDLIRKEYPGTKRGPKTEWDEFKKKFGKEINTDFLRTIWLGLDAKRKTHKELMAAGQFVPEWPHFKTYLNQRRWEEKTEVRETPSPEPKREPSAFKSLQEHFEYWGGTATPTPTTPTPA